jgi:hypothetical protein
MHSTRVFEQKAMMPAFFACNASCDDVKTVSTWGQRGISEELHEMRGGH